MKTKTRQELFDNAWLQFERQRWERSYDERTEACLYRGPDGRKCAIGANIPDEDYCDKFEHYACTVDKFEEGPGNEINLFIQKAAGISEDDTEFAGDLQHCHDCSDGDLEARMREFAKDRGLTIPGEP